MVTGFALRGNAAEPASGQAERVDSPSQHEGMPFKLIVSTDGDLQLAPLGNAALLSKGTVARRLYLIRDGMIQEVDGLNDLDIDTFPSSWAAGGTWPDNVWMAISNASDAGPNWSWIYRWKLTPRQHGETEGGSWELLREHFESVGEVIPWRGGAFLIAGNSALAFPYNNVTWVTPSKDTHVATDFCVTLRRKYKQTSLPDGCSRKAEVVDSPPEMPKSFVAVESSDDGSWGLSAGQLLHWRSAEWVNVAYLPSSKSEGAAPCTLTPNITRVQLWVRSETDLWLTISDDGCGQVWSTTGGKNSVTFFSDGDEFKLLDKRSEWDDSCPYVMVDTVALRGDPINGTSWRMSIAQGRAIIRKALRKHPEFRQLPFFRYPCFGFDCIGARVPDLRTGEALRKAVGSEQYDHNYASPLYCGPHPLSQLFQVYP